MKRLKKRRQITEEEIDPNKTSNIAKTSLCTPFLGNYKQTFFPDFESFPRTNSFEESDNRFLSKIVVLSSLPMRFHRGHMKLVILETV